MRRSALASLLLLALASTPSGVRAASIDVRIVHSGNPTAGADLELFLLGVRRDGETLTREARTDAAGRHLFTDLPSDSVYLVMVEYAGIRFPGVREIFEENEADATKQMTVHVFDASEDASSLQIPMQRWFVARGEAGSYRIRQTLTVSNPSDRVIQLPPSAEPAIRVGLMRERGKIVTRFGKLPDGAEEVGDTLVFRGPLFPGEREIEFSYEVDAGGLDLATEIALPGGAETLELYIQDVGVAIDAGSLHPGQPVRLQDSFYQRYLGFYLEAGVRIPLRIRSLPDRTADSPWAQAALVASITLALVVLVGRPVTRGVGPGERDTAPTESADTREREALFVALADLEDDLETGKLTVEDHARLREELRADTLRALAAMRQPAAAEPPNSAGAPTEVRVCSCGREACAGDRFCSGCGAAL